MDVLDIFPRHHTFLLLSEETTIKEHGSNAASCLTLPHQRYPCCTGNCESTQTFLPSVVLVRHFVTAWRRVKDRMRRVSFVPEE